MMYRRAPLLALVLLLMTGLWPAGPASAQIAPGLRNVDAIEFLATAASVCGVVAEDLLEGRALVEKEEGLAEVQDNEDLTLVITHEDKILNQICLGDLDLRIFSYQEVELAKTGVRLLTTVEVYEHGLLLADPNPVTFRARIKQEALRLIDLFLQDWRAAQGAP